MPRAAKKTTGKDQDSPVQLGKRLGTKELSDKVFQLESRLGTLESTVTDVSATVTTVSDTSTEILSRLKQAFPAPSLPPGGNAGDNRPAPGKKTTTRSAAAAARAAAAPYQPPDVTAAASADNGVPAVHIDLDAADTAQPPAVSHLGLPAVTAPTAVDSLTVYPSSSQYLPLSMQQATNPIVGLQVQALLDTAQHISSIKGRPSHPHDYICRGPTRVKTGLNLLEAPEYLFGLRRLATDERTPHIDRPLIHAHFDDVLHDAKDYDWPQVREWSEEVLTGVAEGYIRWTDPARPGWTDPEIASLRNTTARVRAGRIFPTLASVQAAASNSAATAKSSKTAPSAPRYAPTPQPQPQVYVESYPTQHNQPHSQPQPQPQQAARRRKKPLSSANRTDIPCEAYNTPAGCMKQDGHIDANVQNGHHCSWCRNNLQVIYYHTYPACNIKTNPKFQPFRA